MDRQKEKRDCFHGWRKKLRLNIKNISNLYLYFFSLITKVIKNLLKNAIYSVDLFRSLKLFSH